MARFLDVSNRYRTGFVPGHLTSFHGGLAVAAQSAGHTFTVAARADKTLEADELVSIRLPSARWDAIADALEPQLRSAPPHIVLVYEGGLECLAAFKRLASRAPQHVFLVNLFFGDHLLNMPQDRPRCRSRRNAFGSLAELASDMPKNLRVLAESDRRAFLARHLGLEVAAIWPWHSSIVGLPRPTENSLSEPIRVLLALNNWQLEDHPRTLRDVYAVLHRARRWNSSVRFELLGNVKPFSRRLRRRRRVLRLLPGSTSQPVPMPEYARRLASADVVWLPTQGLYTGQSSGKALDALVMGRPLLAPAGTFGHLQQDRWVPGSLTYRTVEELFDVFDHLPALIEGWSADMRSKQAEIEREYTPDRAIAKLLEVASVIGSITAAVPQGGHRT